MKISHFILGLLFTSTVFSQQESYHEDAMRYFEINGTEKQYSEAIDQMYELLKKQYTSLNVPSSVWKQLENNKKQPLQNIKALLVSAYRSNFSHQELKELLSFYESETGKQVVADISKLTPEQSEEFAKFLNSAVGQKVQNQSESLKMMVGEVSELWSRDLYRDVVSKLKEQGYAISSN